MGWAGCGIAILLALADARFTAAQLDPSRDAAELPAIAAWFPDPDVRYGSPGLRDGRRDFTSHAEAQAFMRALADRGEGRVSLEPLGESQNGLTVSLMVLTGRDRPQRRPTVLVIGQQHGNEPAGGEAALALAEQLAGPRADLLERVTVLIIPRANPDGAERFTRATAGGIDVNRDHLLLQTPEARAIADVMRRHRPHVVLDLHEFTVGDRWVRKFGVVQRYDALIQAATVGNLHPDVAALAEREFEEPIRRALAREGQLVFSYHTTSPDPADQTVSMGGVQPDTGRNVSGLRQAVSLLIETRGVGIGRAHFLRRVHAHVTASLAAIERAGALGGRLVSRLAEADADVSAQACRGALVIDAELTPGRRMMRFLDATTGYERRINVDWRAADRLRVRRTRPRPCGYLLAASERPAADRLRALGITVTEEPDHPADRPRQFERYVIESLDRGARQDARGSIDGGAAIDVMRVRTEPAPEQVAAGTFFVSLAQPLGSLAAAALEPDSQSSFAANRLLAIDEGRLRRVVLVPARAGGASPGAGAAEMTDIMRDSTSRCPCPPSRPATPASSTTP